MKKNKKEESKIASLKNSSVKKNKIDSITEKGPIKQKSDKKIKQI